MKVSLMNVCIVTTASRMPDDEMLASKGLKRLPEQTRRRLESSRFKFPLKSVIRGDKCTGKTALFNRLQGTPLFKEYATTPQIQVAHINWAYKATDDVVDVEVWDVVDHSTVPNENGGESIALDASTIDVYRNASVVVFMVNLTKKWTLDYVIRQLQHVPLSLPVLGTLFYYVFHQ